MTRIDTPLASPATDKPADKAIGKVTSKGGDSRQAAFRSLLRQLGGHEDNGTGTSGKEPKTLSDDAAPRGLPTVRRRVESKDDKAAETLPENNIAAEPVEQIASGEPVRAWQTILGECSVDRREQPAATVDLTALISARAGDTNVSAGSPEKTAPTASDRPGRPVGAALPSTAGLNLMRGDAVSPATTDTVDPFAALSSLLEKANDTVTEPETADMAPIKMSIVTRETHFEPVARLSPVQQIVTAVGEELVAANASAPTEAAPQLTEPSRHTAGPLKVLHIKLEPEDLGAVVVKMRLVDRSLELEVVASRQETADLLAKDRDMLTRALRGSGYTTDVVAITASTTPDSSQMTGDNRSGAQTSSGHPGAQAGGNRGSNDPAGSGGRPPARPQPGEGVNHEESGAGRSGGDLYL
ncbi:flagellar hook-length control protein FliK [Pleomorphomonas sp. PLEO]|uniref:flagellar hook-length control protein FliK n=1 Tax=Pleomorphomonas sp. PLEO TaxID=3239306 RepID=UPI00351E0F6C